MSEAVLSALCWAEYDFAQIDSDLGELAGRLANAGHTLPSCAGAATKLVSLRLALRGVLNTIDNELTAAIRAAEETGLVG